MAPPEALRKLYKTLKMASDCGRGSSHHNSVIHELPMIYTSDVFLVTYASEVEGDSFKLQFLNQGIHHDNV